MTSAADRVVAAAQARLRELGSGGFAAIQFEAERYPSHPAIEVGDGEGRRSVAVFVAARRADVYIWREPRLEGESGKWVRVGIVLGDTGRGWPERLGRRAAEAASRG